MFEFAWPWVFALAPLPWLLRLVLPAADSGEAALKVSFLDELESLAGRRARARLPAWRQQVRFALLWFLLLLAAARPQWVGAPLPLPASGRDLLLAVDVSGSMDYRDMRWQEDEISRLELIKKLFGDFIEDRRGDRVGLILFGSQAYLQAPLTFDRHTVRVWLDEAQIGIAGKNTAIGDAIGLAVKRLRQRPAESRVLVLITDGANTGGQIAPQIAAQLAAEQQVKIYTIGIGADPQQGGVPGLFGFNPGLDLDEPTLRGIAESTGGEYFRARSSAELESISATLDRLEPVAQQTTRARGPGAVQLAAGRRPRPECAAGGAGTLATGKPDLAAPPFREATMNLLLDAWPHWLRPYWLLLAPLLGWLLWKLLHRQRRAGRWQLLLPTAFQPWLLVGGAGRQNRMPWICLGIAWLLALLALLGPSWQQLEQPSMKRSDPLVAILQLTPGMLAGDLSPTRLEQARRKLLDLLRTRNDAQTAIVVYAGSAHTLVPLSDDQLTARNLLDALKPSIMPEPGQRADLAVRQALDLLEQGAQGRGRLLLLTSELSEPERQGIRSALEHRAARLAVLGVGTPKGAPVQQEDGSFLKDDQGGILLPRLDESGLRRFAAEIGAGYQRLRPNDRDLDSLGLLARGGTLEEDRENALLRLQRWADQGYWLLLPLLLLAACAGRRGWLFCLPLLMLSLPQPAMAFQFEDLWLRPDQQGQRLLQRGQADEAAKRFEDFRWKGLSLYQARDYAAAAQAFAQGDQADDHYNRGNALARQGELEAAVDAYEQALERQPQLVAAQRNKALVEELLRQRQEQAAQQQAGENKEQRQEASQQSPPSGSSQRPPRDAATVDAQKAQAAAPSTSLPEDEGEKTAGAPGQAQPQPNAEDERTGDEEADDGLDDERRQALEQWLRQIPDDPAELLRRKFWYQQQQRQEATP
ncbi:VWA domain-containing protein [Pseudomonas aeruginosa]